MSTAVSAQPLAFGWRTDVSVPQAPRAIAAADVNGDGWQDLVLAGTGPGTVSVLTSMGIEDGDEGERFDPPRNITVGGGPFEVAVGDLNRDGRPDIAVANADSNTINLLFGIGRGEFAPQVDLPFDGNPRGIALGDFDRDGILDIAATKYMGSTLEVLYGAGDGTFPRRLALQAPANAQGIAVGDINLDGWPDLVVASGGGVVSVYEMFATGAVLRTLHPAAMGWNVLAVSDLDRDGRLDIAVASTGSSVVQILYNRAGGWTVTDPIPVASSPRGIAAADLDRNGSPEVVVAGRASSAVTVITRAASGALSTADFQSGSGARAVVLADFDNSGHVDIATANEYGRGATVLHNTTQFPRAAFAFDRVEQPETYYAQVFGVADFNHNGKPDIVRPNYVYLDGTANSRYLGPGPGSGFSNAGAVADFNRDGNPDVLYQISDHVQFFYGDGSGGFTDGPQLATPGFISRMVVGDLNRDGQPDIVFISSSGTAIPAGIEVWLGTGGGSFFRGVRTNGSWTAIGLGDVDGDGIVDIVGSSLSGVNVLLGDGRGGVRATRTFGAGSPWFGFALADLNEDGRLDLAVINGETVSWSSSPWQTARFTIARGNGDGTFEALGVYDSQPPTSEYHRLYSLTAGDVDSDGHADIMTSSGDLYFGTGAGDFQDPQRFGVSAFYSPLFADVNGDGLNDVLGFQTYGDQYGVVTMMNTTRAFNNPPTGLMTADHVVWPYDQYWWDTDENELDAGYVHDLDMHAIRFTWALADGTIVSTTQYWTPKLNPGTYQVTITADDYRGGSISNTFTLDVPPFKEMVLTPGWEANLYGAWQSVDDPTAAEGRRVWHPNAGAPKQVEALANPVNFFEMSFIADPTQTYKLWVRMKAEGDSWANDSVFLQFTGAKDANGNPIYEIGTTSALAVNLEECSGCGESGWGWEDDGWGAVNKNGTTLRFPAGGPQIIRVQTREDGVSIDEIVLSAEKYLTTRPGTAKNDTTILPRLGPYLYTPPR